MPDERGKGGPGGHAKRELFGNGGTQTFRKGREDRFVGFPAWDDVREQNVKKFQRI